MCKIVQDRFTAGLEFPRDKAHGITTSIPAGRFRNFMGYMSLAILYFSPQSKMASYNSYHPLRKDYIPGNFFLAVKLVHATCPTSPDVFTRNSPTIKLLIFRPKRLSLPYFAMLTFSR